MRHGCRESPVGYRDVPSGRASVAGEFVRVARLHRARMSGQAFLVPFVAFDKRDSPEGAKQETSEHSERRATPSPTQKSLGSRVRGNDEGRSDHQTDDPSALSIATYAYRHEQQPRAPGTTGRKRGEKTYTT
jgi:hypothetical protein